MFSVTYTGMKSLPLWTSKVSPIISGVIIERRVQVRITCLELVATACSTFFCRLGSTNGPFRSERAICESPAA